MARHFDRWMFLGFAGTAVLLGRLIPASSGESMPQVRGEDAFAQVLGETRLAVSQALLEKADEYFHGGVRHADCDHGLTASSARAGHGHGHGHGHGQAEEGYAARGRFDPWGMINRRVHVQERRHLQGAEAKELLPWLWAANRMSADNLQAFQSSVYVLNRMLGNPQAAQELLEQGIARNPGSADLEFELGELRLRVFKDAVKSEAAFRAALEKNPRSRAEKDGDARLLRLRTLFYLGYLSKLKGDTETLRRCQREAEELSPQHVCARDLRKLLEHRESPPGALPSERGKEDGAI